MGIVHKLVNHIKNGTLTERWKKRGIVRKEKLWSKFLESNDPFFNMQTTNGSILRLSREFGSSKKVYVYDAEKDEVDTVTDLLRPGETFMDIGAHIGYFTVSSAKKVGSNGKVIAVEPTPNTLARLKDNITFNNFENVEICEKAFSTTEGKSVIYVHEANEGYNSMTSGNAGTKSLEISTIPLDKYAEENGLMGSVAVLKIDVEGWEWYVFKGGERFFSSETAPIVMFEFSEKNQNNAGKSCKELRGLIESFGYKVYLYHRDTKRIELLPLQDVYSEVYNPIAAKSIGEIRKRLFF